jgi:hypothetical protein
LCGASQLLSQDVETEVSSALAPMRTSEISSVLTLLSEYEANFLVKGVDEELKQVVFVDSTARLLWIAWT